MIILYLFAETGHADVLQPFPAALQCQDLIAFLQSGLLCRRARMNGVDDRIIVVDRRPLHHADTDKQQPGQQDVHRRTGRHDDDLLPGGDPVETPLLRYILHLFQFLAAIVLPGHHHIPAKGDGADRQRRFAEFMRPQAWSHADGKLMTVHAEFLGGDQMAQLMDDDNDAEQHDKRE